MLTFGIIGYPLEHSASAEWFNAMFARNGYNARYHEFALPTEQQLEAFLKQREFAGVNITYPYKQTVMSMIDELEPTAAAVGAVNVIDNHGGRLVGYNTDIIGFEASLMQMRNDQGFDFDNIKALILGTGGAARAVAYALAQKGIEYCFVSREKSSHLLYSRLDAEIIRQHQLIINCTPLGMFPDTDAFPDIPYEGICPGHVLFDAIYNPEETLFLRKGRQFGAATYNGRLMLVKQAEAAWQIWKRHIKN